MDLKSKNILLNKDQTLAKIADVGLSRGTATHRSVHNFVLALAPSPHPTPPAAPLPGPHIIPSPHPPLPHQRHLAQPAWHVQKSLLSRMSHSHVLQGPVYHMCVAFEIVVCMHSPGHAEC